MAFAELMAKIVESLALRLCGNHSRYLQVPRCNWGPIFDWTICRYEDHSSARPTTELSLTVECDPGILYHLFYISNLMVRDLRAVMTSSY